MCYKSTWQSLQQPGSPPVPIPVWQGCFSAPHALRAGRDARYGHQMEGEATEAGISEKAASSLPTLFPRAGADRKPAACQSKRQCWGKQACNKNCRMLHPPDPCQAAHTYRSRCTYAHRCMKDVLKLRFWKSSPRQVREVGGSPSSKGRPFPTHPTFFQKHLPPSSPLDDSHSKHTATTA